MTGTVVQFLQDLGWKIAGQQKTVFAGRHLYQSHGEHAPGFFQVHVPTEGFAQDVWRVAADGAGLLEAGLTSAPFRDTLSPE